GLVLLFLGLVLRVTTLSFCLLSLLVLRFRLLRAVWLGLPDCLSTGAELVCTVLLTSSCNSSLLVSSAKLLSSPDSLLEELASATDGVLGGAGISIIISGGSMPIPSRSVPKATASSAINSSAGG